MKLTIKKENGDFLITLDEEMIIKDGKIVIREIALFSGQAAVITAKRRTCNGDSLEITIGAERNGQKIERRNWEYLQSQFPLDASYLAKFPIHRWIEELTDWAKKIPLKEEWELEF